MAKLLPISNVNINDLCLVLCQKATNAVTYFVLKNDKKVESPPKIKQKA
jgi:hypothetical protein